MEKKAVQQDPGKAVANEVAKDVDDKPLAPAQADEIGGPKGSEPTRYGDWERKGRCVDF